MENDVSEQMIEFNKIYKMIDDTYHNYAKSCDLSNASLWILYSVWENNETYTQKELCEVWSYSRQTINSALKNLEGQGLIQLLHELDNKKNKQIILTKRGKGLAEKVIVPLMEAEKNSFASLSNEERCIFLKLMKKHAELFGKEVKKIIDKSSEDISSQ